MKIARNALGPAILALSATVLCVPPLSFAQEPAKPAVSGAAPQNSQGSEGASETAPTMQQSEAAYAAGDYAKALDGKTLSEAKDCQGAEESVMATVGAINQIVETLDGLIVYNGEQAEALGSQSEKLKSARARCATAGK